MQHDVYLYDFEKQDRNKTKKYWRCEQFKTKGVQCKGRLHTNLDDKMLKTVGQHNCTPKSGER